MSIISELAKLSPPDAILLTGLEQALLQPDEGSSDQDWMVALGAHLAGRVSWTHVVQRALDKGDVLLAMEHAARMHSLGATLSLEMSNRVAEAVTQLQSSIAERCRLLQQSMDALGNGVFDVAEIEALAQRVDAAQRFDDCGGGIALVTGLRQRLQILESVEHELTAAKDLEWEAKQETLRRVHAAAYAAWRRLMGHEDSPRPIDGDDSILLLALPQLVLNSDVQRLEKVARGDSVVDVAPPSFTRVLERSYATRRSTKPPSPVNLAALDLSPVSTAVLRQAPHGTGRLVTSRELTELRSQARRLLDDRQRALFWLSMRAEAPELARVLVGEGLLSEGLSRLRHREFLHAKKLLADAMTCVSDAGPLAESSVEAAAIALSVAWAWPPFLAIAPARQASGDIVVSWLDDPSSMVEDLREFGLRNVLASVWSDELRSDVANGYFEAVIAVFGDEGLLLQAAARSLLTATNLRRRADRVREGVQWLLCAGASLQELEAPFGRLFDELGPELFQSTSAHGRVRTAVEEIKSALATFSGLRPAAPTLEISHLLDEIVGMASQTKEPFTDDPQLNAHSLVETFFPEELSEDVEFPVQVRNAESAAPARDVSLVLRLEGASAAAPTVTTEAVDVGTLNPGESQQATFYLDVPKGAAERVSEYRFRVEVRVGTRVTPRALRVAVQPGSRQYRSSPYVAGAAVTGEQFVGREREMARILSSFTGDVVQRPLLVYGIRRIGKTSILQHTVKHPEIVRRFRPLYWSVEDRDETDTSCDFLMELCERIRNQIPEAIHSRLRFHRAEFRSNPYQAFEAFSDSLERAALEKPVLLVLDEFDKLLSNARKSSERSSSSGERGPCDAFQPEVFAALRKVVMGKRSLQLVVGGLPSILQQQYGDRLFGLLDPIEINPFDRKDAASIIDAARPIMNVHPLAREAILRASGLHPYLLQLVCNKLFHRAKFSGRDPVCLSDVRDVIDGEILPQESYFTDYVSLIGEEWPILWALARAQRSAGRDYVSLREIVDALRSEGLGGNEADIRVGLDGLRAEGQRPLVARNPSKRDSYKLPIGVLADYLLKRGPRR